jgi:hypothetical protein
VCVLKLKQLVRQRWVHAKAHEEVRDAHDCLFQERSLPLTYTPLDCICFVLTNRKAAATSAADARIVIDLADDEEGTKAEESAPSAQPRLPAKASGIRT